MRHIIDLYMRHNWERHIMRLIKMYGKETVLVSKWDYIKSLEVSK